MEDLNVPRMLRCDLHTHTTFCDGMHSPEEMVLSAIERGMDVIGFSGHSYVPWQRSCMSREGSVQYCRELQRLRDLYGEKILILTGLEADLHGIRTDDVFDYVIGSVHDVLLDGEPCPIDSSEAVLTEVVRTHCRGDFYRLIREYYRAVATVVDVTKCDIIGHFDVISKFNDGGKLFDENDPRYLKPAVEALDVLLEKNIRFELNTGAMARGYRKYPYPAPLLLRRIAEKGGQIVLGSDAHCKEHLLHAFPVALQLAKHCGVGSVQVITRQGWKSCTIDGRMRS